MTAILVRFPNESVKLDDVEEQNPGHSVSIGVRN